MKKWLNRRKNQITILLTAISILTVSNVILPAYDALSYFQNRSVSLERQYQHLYGYSLHVRHHEDHLPELRKQLQDLEHRFTEFRNTSQLQNRLSHIQRQYQLKVETQETQKERLSKDLEIIRISQTLIGKYEELMNYLSASMEIDDRLLLEHCLLENREPLSNDPSLTARLQFTLFLPAR